MALGRGAYSDCMAKPYRRRSGVIYKPGILGNPERPARGYILDPDGGDDAPLSPRGRAIFLAVLLGIFVLFVAIVLLTYLGY
jgi:hypothetical protein